MCLQLIFLRARVPALRVQVRKSARPLPGQHGLLYRGVFMLLGSALFIQMQGVVERAAVSRLPRRLRRRNEPGVCLW